jgi:hypothetical protein
VKILRELWAGVMGGGDGSGKLELVVLGVLSCAAMPQVAWPVGFVVGCGVLARGYVDGQKAKPR